MAKWQKTSSGAPLSIPAASWNALMDMGAEWDRRREQGSPALSAERPGACLVKNSSGAARAAFSVLAVTGSLIAPADNLDEFKRLPAVVAGNPTAVSRTLVVIQRQARVDEIVDGLLCGSSICQVNVSKEDHGYAVPAAGGIPASAAAGPLRILWKAAGTGNVWALVSWPASPKTAVTIGAVAGSYDFVTDGTADNVQWQAAIDLAAALGAPIVAAAGTYTLAAALTVPAGARVSIRSSNTSSVVFQPASAISYCIQAGALSELLLQYVTIQADGATKFGIGISADRLSAASCTVDECSGSYGITANDCNLASVLVSDCTSGTGIVVQNGRLNAASCTVDSCAAGIETTNSITTLQACTVSNHTNNGINCNGASMVIGCTASNNGQNGIVATIVVGSTATNNGVGAFPSRYDLNAAIVSGCTATTKNVGIDLGVTIFYGTQAFVTAVDFVAQTVTTKTLATNVVGAAGRITSIT